MIGCTNDRYAKKIDTTKSIVFGIMIQRKKKNIWNDIDTYVQIKFYQIISSILETNRDKNSRSTLQDEIPLFIIFFFFFTHFITLFPKFQKRITCQKLEKYYIFRDKVSSFNISCMGNILFSEFQKCSKNSPQGKLWKERVIKFVVTYAKYRFIIFFPKGCILKKIHKNLGES